MQRVLYVKNSSSKVNLSTYNVQAVGLGRAFCELGYDYDFLFFSSENKQISEEIIGQNKLRIISMRGVRVLRSYFCLKALNKDFLSQYDIIITTEYGQIMSYFLSKKSNRVVLYSGPYYNLFKIPVVSPVYDFLFTKQINKNIRCKFVKSAIAKEFLEKKGYTNLENIGVALDVERFNSDVEILSETKQLMQYMKENRCILYVGALSDRKNYPFLLDIYKKLLRNNPDVKFVMIGKGKNSYVNKYMSMLPDDVKKGIYRLERIDNAQLKYIYPLAKAFLLPSKLEIFGMVLLEAMYLGAPVVTSWNGGSSTLIYKKNTGLIVEKFDSEQWKDAIQKYLNDDNFKIQITENAKCLIKEEYNWHFLAKKMLDTIKGE